MSKQERIVCLVQCVGQKGTAPAPARDLYVSPLFQKMRAVVEHLGGPWFVLSAKHGLLRPDERVHPYDLTLNHMRAPERRAWAQRVIGQMEASLPPADRVIVFAGQKYREGLMDWLVATCVSGRYSAGGPRDRGSSCGSSTIGFGGRRNGDTPPLVASTSPGTLGRKRTHANQGGTARRRGTSSDRHQNQVRTARTSKIRASASVPRSAVGIPVVELSFAEIHELVGGLPRSAYAHRPWWSNNRSHPHARAWLDTGREADVDWIERSVRFRNRGGR